MMMLIEVVVWGKLDVGGLKRWGQSKVVDELRSWLYVSVRAKKKVIYFKTINLNLHRRVGRSLEL
jgi:hypothetical protein